MIQAPPKRGFFIALQNLSLYKHGIIAKFHEGGINMKISSKQLILGFVLFLVVFAGAITAHAATSTVCAPDKHEFYVEKVVAASCTQVGGVRLRCKTCGTIKDEVMVPKLEHDMKQTEVRATCAKSGWRGYQCTRCGLKQQKQYINPTGHNYVTISRKEAACGSNGLLTQRCNGCKDIITSLIEAKPHTWFITSKTAPTCTTNGSETYKCDTCKRTRTVTLKALGHSKHTITKAATCWQNGSVRVICAHKGCNITFSNTIIPSSTVHTWKKVLGSTYICTHCGITKK